MHTNNRRVCTISVCVRCACVHSCCAYCHLPRVVVIVAGSTASARHPAATLWLLFIPCKYIKSPKNESLMKVPKIM